MKSCFLPVTRETTTPITMSLHVYPQYPGKMNNYSTSKQRRIESSEKEEDEEDRRCIKNRS